MEIVKGDKLLFFFNLCLVSINSLFIAFLIRTLYPIHLMGENLFYADLLTKPLTIPLWLTFIFSNINVVILSILSQFIWNKRQGLILPLLYILNPWSVYLTSLNSFYIYLTSLILMMIFGLILVKSEYRKIGIIVLILGGVLLIYSSLIIFIISPLIITGVLILKLFNKNEIRNLSFWIILFSIPLFIAIFKNPVGWANIYRNQVNIYSGSGHLSDINSFQGQAQAAGFKFFSKIAENKYVYFVKYTSLKIIKNLTPSTYFTPQEKLANFSFSPPIFLGFLLPFLYGGYLLFKSSPTIKFFGVSLILIIPALLSKQFVDLNRLVIFSFVIFYVISYGLIKLYQSKNFSHRITFLLAIVLVIIQFLVTLSDIYLREYPRFERTFSINFEIR